MIQPFLGAPILAVTQHTQITHRRRETSLTENLRYRYVPRVIWESDYDAGRWEPETIPVTWHLKYRHGSPEHCSAGWQPR